VILPQVPQWDLDAYLSHFKAQKVEKGFNYSSGQNSEWESVESLRKLILEHVDLNFNLD
jgi:hypothetical protein